MLNPVLFNFHGEITGELYKIPKNVTIVMLCKMEICPVIASDLFLFKMATEKNLSTKIDYLSYLKNNFHYSEDYCVFEPNTEIYDLYLTRETDKNKFISGAYVLPIVYNSKLENILEEEELYYLSKRLNTKISSEYFDLDQPYFLSYVIDSSLNTLGDKYNDEYLFIVSACRSSLISELDENYNKSKSLNDYILELKVKEDEYVVVFDKEDNIRTSFKINQDLLSYYINPEYFSTREKVPNKFHQKLDLKKEHGIFFADKIYSFYENQENKIIRYMFMLINLNDIVSVKNQFVFIFNYYNSKIYRINIENCYCEDITYEIPKIWVSIGNISLIENDNNMIYIKINDDGDILFSVNRELVSSSYLNFKLTQLIEESQIFNEGRIIQCINTCVKNDIEQGKL